MKAQRRWKGAALCACAAGIIFLPAATSPADLVGETKLNPETVAAFEQYVRTRDAQIEENTRKGFFLYTETLSDTLRMSMEADLRQGKISILEVTTISPNQPIRIPHGLIHDWVGIAFIPGATAEQVNAVLLDFNRQQIIYNPDIRKSKLIENKGNEYRVSQQFYTKSILTVVENGDFDVEYIPISDARSEIKSHSTRFAEVANAGKPNEQELPPEKQHGYVWRMNTHWKIEERDGGTYIQVESIGLTRGVPALFAIIVNPLLRSIPKKYLADSLNGTRKAVVEGQGARTVGGHTQ
ncbi:MAG TPA: hypothetical protein VLV89_12470 [Candidatus Acidoferrum sp.]|nr:hypothetical protein [Candidatus Acidoferrum sp.]